MGNNRDNSKIQLRDLGERQAIELVKSLLTNNNEKIAIGPGDDCAAIEFGGDYLLISTDMAVQKTHFPPGISPYQMGWFVVAINLSDLSAKGAEPLGVVVATGLPTEYTKNDLIELIKGMNTCATNFGTIIIGGDLKEHDQITLTGTALGQVSKSEFMPRFGAKSGDIVAVTGTLGGAGAAYHTLINDIKVNESILKKLYMPEPRLDEGQILAKTHAITASMDISDGLANSLYQLAQINNVGFEICFDSIPIQDGSKKLSEQLNISIDEFTLYSGGDYELLVTVKPEAWNKVKASIESINGSISRIGYVTKGPDIKLIKNDIEIKLEDRGYEHFKHQNSTII